MSLSEAAEVAFAEGLKAVENGDLDSALEMFTRACALNPDDARFQGYRAWAQYHTPLKNDPEIDRSAHQEDCRLRLLEAVEQSQNYDPLYVLLGTVHMGEQNTEAAAKAFQKALEINPENNGALIGLQAAKRQSSPGRAFDLNRFAPQTIPSPRPPSFSKNRIIPSTTPLTTNTPHSRKDQSRHGNVFSSARLRSQIDELKRARTSDRSQYEDINIKQNQELTRLKGEYEANIEALKNQMDLVTQEKDTLQNNFDEARQTLAAEKERISSLAQDQERAVQALSETHHNIRNQIHRAQSDAQELDGIHTAELQAITKQRKKLIGELDHTKITILDLEDSLGVEQEQLEAFHENINDLSKEFGEAKRRYELEIEAREEERTNAIQKANQEKSELRHQIDQLQQAHQSGMQSTHARDLEIQGLRYNIEDIENELAKKTENLSATEKELKAKLVVLEHQTTENETKRIELQHREDQLTSLRGNLEQAEQELSSKQNQIDDLDIRLDDARTVVSRINNELEASRAEVNHLREEKREAESRESWIQKAETQLESRQTQIESLTNELERSQDEIHRLRSDKTQQERDRDALLLKIEEIKTEASLKPSAEDLEEIKRNFDRSRFDLERAKKQGEAIQKQLDNVEHQRSQDQDHILNLKAEADEKRAENRRLKMEFEKYDVEKGGLLSQIEDLKTEASLRPTKKEIDKIRGELAETRKSLEVSREQNKQEKYELSAHIEELEQQLSVLPTKNEIDFVRGKLEESQTELEDARGRIEEERIRIEELERLSLAEHQKMMAFEKKAGQDQTLIDQAKAQRELLEEKYAKTAGTLVTVLDSIQSQLNSEKERTEKLQRENATTIAHLSDEKDNLSLELRDTYKHLEDARKQLEYIEKGNAYNKKELEDKLEHYENERNELAAQHERETSALNAQLIDSEAIHSSRIESIEQNYLSKLEDAQLELSNYENIHQSHVQTQAQVETNFKERENELTRKLDKQALLVFEIKDEFDRKQKDLTKEIDTLHDALAFANDQLAEQTQEIDGLLEEQNVLLQKHADARQHYAEAQAETRNANEALQITSQKLESLENQEEHQRSLIENLHTGHAEGKRILSEKRSSEKDLMNTVEVYERKLKNLEGRLKRSTSELTATQQTKTEQKEELTRQLKLAYTQVEDLEDRVIAVAAEQTHNESQLKRNLQTKELRLKELTSENQHLRQSLHAQNDLDSVKGQRDTIDMSYSELSDDHPVSQLKSQLNDAKTALTQAQTEALDSRKSIDRIKVEESSRNERLQAEIRELKKVAEQTLNEKANAEAELATAQAQINGLDQNHHSVYARANDDLEAARSRLAAVEAASSKKQENLLSQLHQAEQEIRELRKLDQEARNALIEKEHEWASFRDTPENELRSQLVEARSELKKVESKRNEGRSSLQSELEDLRAELEDARRARMQVEQTFLSQFQRLELQYQSRVSELKAHFDHQLGLSSIPEEQRSDSPPRLETNLDVPDLAELSAVGRQAQLSSELPIHASGFENIASSKTIPAPASVIAGGPPPPPTDESYVEIESSDVYTSDLDRQEKASSPTPNSRGKISEANKQNFASVKELLSSMNLPFPELDESGVPQELPDESMLEEETIQESQQPGMGSDGFSEKASRALNTSKLPLPSAQKPRKGRIKTLLSKLSGAELESERPAPNAGDGRPRSDRHHVRFQMSFDNGEDYHVARVRDISETGVYLETAEPQPLGAILTLSPLGMKDFDELELRAKVVRSKQYAPHDFGKESPGMGLRFVPMKDKVRKKLLFLVRQLEDREIRQVGQIDPFLGVRIPSKNADGTDGEERMPIRILGGGLRAGEIAYQLVRHNIPIHLSSVEDQSLDGAMQQVQMRFDADVARGMLNRAEAAKRLRLISTSNKNIDISKVQTIIEAVADPLSIKKAVIKQLEKKIPRDCTIITVVSEGHMVTSIADGLRHPNRLCGIHFVSSTENVGLVEVVRGKLTSQHALDQAKNLARGIELKPIVIADEHGLLVHRILGFYFNEAGHLIEDGVSFEAIDEVTKGFGFNKGPLQLMDEFGINFVRKNAEILEAAFGERAKVPPSILSIANSERQGRDSGSGFYQYLDGQMRGIDPQAYLDCGRSEQGSHNALSEDEIRDRLLLTMINEAARSIGDSIIDNPGTLDMAMVMACSFPAFRKGVLHYADALRPTSILDHLEELEEKHGPRFMPALYLRMLAENDALFYQPQ